MSAMFGPAQRPAVLTGAELREALELEETLHSLARGRELVATYFGPRIVAHGPPKGVPQR